MGTALPTNCPALALPPLAAPCPPTHLKLGVGESAQMTATAEMFCQPSPCTASVKAPEELAATSAPWTEEN